MSEKPNNKPYEFSNPKYRKGLEEATAFMEERRKNNASVNEIITMLKNHKLEENLIGKENEQ